MPIRSLIQTLRTPNSGYALGTLAGIGLILGVVGVPSFNAVVHATSSDAFYLTCRANGIFRIADSINRQRLSTYQAPLDADFCERIVPR